MRTYTFTALGQPVPKERPRHNTKTGNTYTPKKTTDAERVISIAFRHDVVGYGVPRLSRFALGVNFYLKRDYGADIDNLLKTVMDGLQGFVYVNDSQVKEIVFAAIEVDPKNPRTEVTIMELDDA